MSLKRVLIFILLAATLLTSAALTIAQDSTGIGKYTGALEALNGMQLTVSGLTFDITSADIDDSLLMEPGTLAEVNFTVTGGALIATYIDNTDPLSMVGIGKISGALESISTETVVIGGLSLNIVGAAIDDDVLLEVGSQTELRFSFDGGILTVHKIEVADTVEDGDNDGTDEDGNEVEDAVAYGNIEAIDGATITVAGVVFDISTAEIDTEGRLEVGAWVRIEFIITETGIAQAVSVEFDDNQDVPDGEDNGDDLENFTLVGTLESFEGSIMVISGVTVDVSQAVLDNDDDIVVGALVKVEFDDLNGVMVAISVESVDSVDDVDDDFEDGDLLGGNDDHSGSESDDSGDDSDNHNACSTPSGWHSYEVHSGDTLSSIAVAAGITLEALMTANCLTDANLITVGYELYTPVELSSGDVDNGDEDSSDDEDNGDDEDNDDEDSVDDNEDGDEDNGDEGDGGDEDHGDEDDGDHGGDDDGSDDDGGSNDD